MIAATSGNPPLAAIALIPGLDERTGLGQNNAVRKILHQLQKSRANKTLQTKCAVVFPRFWKFRASKNKILNASQSLATTNVPLIQRQKSRVAHHVVVAAAVDEVVVVAEVGEDRT
jgi:hypothetical protein